MNLLKDFSGEIDHSGKVLLLDHFMGVGDALWRTCLHRELKRRNPNMKLYISSMGNYWKEIYKTNPFIDKLVDRIGNPPYISGVDYYVSDKLCPHVISDYARKMDALDALEIWSGLEIRDKSFVYEVLPEEQKWADKFLSKYPKPIVGVQLKSSTWVRTWPPEEVIRLIQMLRYNGIFVVVLDNQQFGYKDEGIINLAGGYNIREVAAIVKNLDLLITPDSGILHFGGHFKIPTIAIFGGSDPSCRLKYYNTVYSICNGNKYCKEWPCWSHAYVCPKGVVPSPCLSAITALEVFEMLGQIL